MMQVELITVFYVNIWRDSNLIYRYLGMHGSLVLPRNSCFFDTIRRGTANAHSQYHI
jgi:hypothetical protein